MVDSTTPMEVEDLFASSSESDHFENGDFMDLDDFSDVTKSLKHSKLEKGSTLTAEEELSLNEESLKKLCRDVSISFFKEYGLIHHQINSYNEFVNSGIQRLFDSLEEVVIQPGYDSSKKGDGDWRYASIKFGKVSLEKPTFETKDRSLDLLPRHARLQRVIYSARMKVEMKVQVYTQKLTKSDKFKMGKEEYIKKEVIFEETKSVNFGRIPVMVRSNLCWTNGCEKGDCEFDQGGYFLVKGAEKTFIAQEQICLKRLWVSDSPNWNAQYKSGIKRRRVIIKLMDLSTKEFLQGRPLQKILTINFLSRMHGYGYACRIGHRYDTATRQFSKN